MKEREILINAYNSAKTLDLSNISASIKQDIDILVEKIDSNKSLVSALVTSLLKKIHSPTQDIRLHRTDFENGYSARVLDTQITSPFFKEKFPKYANKESSFLTLATREKIKWTLDEGKHLKIRNEPLKNAFLTIFDQVETHKSSAEVYLQYLFVKLIQLSEQDAALFQDTLQTASSSMLNIQKIIKMLQIHFKEKQSSRLPVIAIYSIYELLLQKVARYKGKKLLPLQVHTSSDKHGFGDIEVYTIENEPFEIIEIKHNVPINQFHIHDIAKKTQKIKVNRYYILTTFSNSFEDEQAKEEVETAVLALREKYEMDVIANGIISTLTYYLRMLEDYTEFVAVYTKNLVADAQTSTEVKSFHLEKWSDIVSENE